jgi:hypothetical protein
MGSFLPHNDKSDLPVWAKDELTTLAEPNVRELRELAGGGMVEDVAV